MNKRTSKYKTKQSKSVHIKVVGSALGVVAVAVVGALYHYAGSQPTRRTLTNTASALSPAPALPTAEGQLIPPQPITATTTSSTVTSLTPTSSGVWGVEQLPGSTGSYPTYQLIEPANGHNGVTHVIPLSIKGPQGVAFDSSGSNAFVVSSQLPQSQNTQSATAPIGSSPSISSQSVTLSKVSLPTGRVATSLTLDLNPKTIEPPSYGTGNIFLGGQVTSGSSTGKWVMDVIDSSTLSVKTSIALPGTLINSQSIGTSEYATISVPSNFGQSYRLIQISTSLGTVTSNNQVPVGFTPSGTADALIWGVEQSTGQLLAVNPATGSVVVRDILSSSGNFTPVYALSTSGTNIYALASTTGTLSSQQVILYKINALDGSVLTREVLSGLHPNAGVGEVVVQDNQILINGVHSIHTLSVD